MRSKTKRTARAVPSGSPTPGDDFFCIRYRVWYPSFDCAIRTRFRTSAGCLRCDQGRFNLKRHAAAVRGVRWRFGGERLRVRGVVFDLDGTLIDGYQGIATALNAARFAFDMPPSRSPRSAGAWATACLT